MSSDFWAKVDRSGPDECWPWTGSLNDGGYGRIAHKGRQTLAHRVAYELTAGAIPDGFVIDHICHDDSCRMPCGHRSCCNPAHLRACTVTENVSRGAHRRVSRDPLIHFQVPYELHRQVKALAAMRGQTLKGFVLAELRGAVARIEQEEAS